MVIEVADRAYVLDQGRIILNGEVDKISNDPHVISAYLGIK